MRVRERFSIIGNLSVMAVRGGDLVVLLVFTRH